MTRTKINIDKAWLKRNGFFCKDAFVAEALKYLKIACAGMLLTLLAGIAPPSLHPEYLKNASFQGLGPELWNVAGTPGLIGLGLFVLFPKRRFFAGCARIALEISYSVGTLMTGVFAGWFLVEAPLMLTKHGFVWTLFFGGVAIVGLSICALMNGFVWYLSWLIRGDMAFQNWLNELKIIHRAAIGAFFVLMPTLTYIFQTAQ
ncbi:hypothetical protein [Pseudomonas sp. MWU13-2105]|uniref:hypothetical protein n=1 Tax=Pseudomonas sp. MWU13-2105 TaxID=2935074 RepID=UPI0020100A5C|nr:hypothetical protein [Pseudomonas sp. MWU13-2105]